MSRSYRPSVVFLSHFTFLWQAVHNGNIRCNVFFNITLKHKPMLHDRACSRTCSVTTSALLALLNIPSRKAVDWLTVCWRHMGWDSWANQSSMTRTKLHGDCTPNSRQHKCKPIKCLLATSMLVSMHDRVTWALHIYIMRTFSSLEVESIS